MAASAHGESRHEEGHDEHGFDAQRLSLFDINMEKARALNKKHLIHRLIFVAKIHSSISEKREIGGYYERLFKQLHSQLQGETFTGLLLIYPLHIVHIVETSIDMLQEVITSLNDIQCDDSGPVCETKILVYAHDIPVRLFMQWSFRVLSVPTSRMEGYNTSESIETVVAEAITLLLKLGDYLAKIPKVNLKTAMDQLHSKVAELLLPQDMIEYFTQSKELCSPKYYLSYYSKPLDIVLDCELVWPMPTYFLPIS